MFNGLQHLTDCIKFTRFYVKTELTVARCFTTPPRCLHGVCCPKRPVAMTRSPISCSHESTSRVLNSYHHPVWHSLHLLQCVLLRVHHELLSSVHPSRLSMAYVWWMIYEGFYHEKMWEPILNCEWLTSKKRETCQLMLMVFRMCQFSCDARNFLLPERWSS